MTKVQSAKDRIKQAWEENPLAVIGVAAAAITAVAKITEAAVSANNSRTWKKEVNRRVKKTQ
jgi:hypothetical protein